MPFDLSAPQTEYVLDRPLPLGTAVVIFIVGWCLSKWIYGLVLKALRTSRLDETVSRLIASIAQWATIALTVAAALGKAGVETTSLAAIFAAAGLAIGLALQGTLGNFAGGILLLAMRPFAIGDRVSLAGHYGDVADIGQLAELQNHLLVRTGEEHRDAGSDPHSDLQKAQMDRRRDSLQPARGSSSWGI